MERLWVQFPPSHLPVDFVNVHVTWESTENTVLHTSIRVKTNFKYTLPNYPNKSTTQYILTGLSCDKISGE